jgi:hypothetical protein
MLAVLRGLQEMVILLKGVKLALTELVRLAAHLETVVVNGLVVAAQMEEFPRKTLET